MSIETLNVAVSGGTPAGDSNDYILFDSTVAFTGGIPSHNLTRLIFTLQNDQAGTLKAKWSANRGTTWNQYDSQSVGIPAASTSSGPFDYDITPFVDFQLVWTNGGVAQTIWRTAMVLTRNLRTPAT